MNCCSQYDGDGELLPRSQWNHDDEEAEEHFKAWEEGRTGFPWIDGLMRQLRTEGWMHHLARHSVACFLTRFVTLELPAAVADLSVLQRPPLHQLGARSCRFFEGQAESKGLSRCTGSVRSMACRLGSSSEVSLMLALLAIGDADLFSPSALQIGEGKIRPSVLLAANSLILRRMWLCKFRFAESEVFN